MTFHPPKSNNWSDHGVVLRHCNLELQSFTACTEPLDGNCWRFWYSSHRSGKGPDEFNIGFAEGEPGKRMSLFPAQISCGKAHQAEFAIGNLPDGWRPRQPIHICMPDSTHRIYFWAHGPGVVRFLCAFSGDGHRYEVIEPLRPCLYHYNDRAVTPKWFGSAGLTVDKSDSARPSEEPAADPGKLCNDATNLYLLPDGSFELYTAVILPVAQDSSHYIAHDNAAGWIRVIERRTSPDGLNWSKGVRVLEPNQDDPPWIQFYYLAVTSLPEGKAGQLGYYDVKNQTMDIEWCFSTDGLNWQRDYPGPWFPRSPKLLGVYAPHSLVFHQRQWHLFYTGCNYNHNGTACTGSSPKSDIRWAAIDSLITL